MTRRINDDRIAKLATKPKQYALTIPTTPGLQIRVSPGGRKAWSLRYQDVDGKQKRRTLGTFPEMSLSEAETAAKTPQECSRVLTLEELVKDYLKRWAKPRRATWREDERVLTGRVLDHFGRRTLAAAIKRRDLAAWLDTMVEEELNAAVARYYGHFRRCLRWAVEVDILDADPTTGVRLPVKEAARERMITDEETRLLWHGLKVRSPSAQHAVRLCLATGLRIGEVVSARWEHVGPDVWTVPATATKAKRQHLVPVSRFLRSLLDDLPSGTGFLFNSPTAASGHMTNSYLDPLLLWTTSWHTVQSVIRLSLVFAPFLT